jgi:hypothetical protein
LISPGILVVVAAFAFYCIAIRIPEIGFGRLRLIVTALGGMSLAAGGLVLHAKAVNDYLNVNRSYWKTVLFTAGTVIAAPTCTLLLLEKAGGLYLSHFATPILVLQPGTTESFHTGEFTFTAKTNSAGIRDREFDLRRKNGMRILAIGDSFTYGWGVNDDEPWPKVLEQHLAKNSHAAEVLNLGCPGASVDAYAEIAESFVPLAKPEFVLVAVLQGIDLKLLQIGKSTDRLFQQKIDSNGRSSRSPVAYAVPNLCEIRARLTARAAHVRSANETREEWKAMTQWMPGRLTDAETERFEALDGEVKKMFLTGDLNPWEVYFALKYPDYVSFVLHPEQPAAREAVNSMARHLERIKAVAERVGARTLVFSVTPAWYVSRRALVAKRKVGYILDDSAIHSEAPDETIRSACQLAGVEFFSFTSRFREIDADRKWYFPFDGMYSAKGQAIYGEEIAKVLLRLLDE